MIGRSFYWSGTVCLQCVQNAPDDEQFYSGFILLLESTDCLQLILQGTQEFWGTIAGARRVH